MRDGVSRRTLLRLGAVGGAGVALVGVQGVGRPFLAERGLLSVDGAFAATSMTLADQLYIEAFPTSPLILAPFTDELFIPTALRPVQPSDLRPAPGPGIGQQNSLRNETHQIWPSQIGFPDPIIYQINDQVSIHSFTTSQVLPIDNTGRPTFSFDVTGQRVPAGRRTLPPSTIYSFNGTFPGPRINAEYGKPALVRFTNQLDQNPLGLDRQDFGTPDLAALTHLHNAHTAPESDGNPHYSMTAGPQHEGFRVGQWVDQLYLNWPAGGDDREKQSFFWFHDHVMDHTGANVYKGKVGLYPIYDPKPLGTLGGTDMGDERQGLRLPGVRTDHSDGSFDVDYDIPLVFFDVRLDDGVTIHKDIHDTLGQFPDAHNPRTHPEWWGKSFYKHFPNHGFVGDIFTVNGTAYPTLEVKRRKYRLRFLDASVSRIYEFKLMASTQGPKSASSLGYEGDELEGQYRIPDAQQCMRFTQIATDGGLLPFPLTRDSFELWPAKRREFVVDFTRYQDGSPTTKGDVIYLTNIMKMPNGRMWTNSTRFGLDAKYKVPVLKIVIGDDAPDDSVMPTPTTPLAGAPAAAEQLAVHAGQPLDLRGETRQRRRGDRVADQRQALRPRERAEKPGEPGREHAVGHAEEEQLQPVGDQQRRRRLGAPDPPAQEEHRIVMRNGRDVTQVPDPGHPDDCSREDTVTQDPGERVIIYRGFRDFVGPYVAHCHNLNHEDHAMMFAWSIT